MADPGQQITPLDAPRGRSPGNYPRGRVFSWLLQLAGVVTEGVSEVGAYQGKRRDRRPQQSMQLSGHIQLP